MQELKNDEWLELLIKDIGEPQDCKKHNEKVIEKYRDKLPEQLFTYWRELGWCSYGDGLFWMVNPDEYKDMLNSWLEGTLFANRKNLSVIARNAFGGLYIWEKGKGMVFEIDPGLNIITYNKEKDENNNFTIEEEKLEMQMFWGIKDKEDIDYQDDSDKPLFDRCLKKFGRLKEDEAYGYKLHPSLGGGYGISNMGIVKLDVYQDISLQMAETEWIVLD